MYNVLWLYLSVYIYMCVCIFFVSNYACMYVRTQVGRSVGRYVCMYMVLAGLFLELL